MSLRTSTPNYSDRGRQILQDVTYAWASENVEHVEREWTSGSQGLGMENGQMLVMFSTIFLKIGKSILNQSLPSPNRDEIDYLYFFKNEELHKDP